MDEPSWSADPAIQTMAFTAALVVSSTTFTLSTIMHGMTSGLSNYGPRQLRSALARLAHLLSLESFARAAQALAHRAANAVRVAGTPLIVGGGIAMGALVGLLMVVLAGPALTVPSAAVGLGVAALGGATVAGNLAVSRAARAAEAERARSAALADRAAALENALQESRRDALEIMTQAREASELRMQLSESHTERASLVKRAEADQKDFKRRIVGLEAELQITRQQKGAAEAQLQSLEAERARLVADVKRQKSKIFSLEARAAELEAEREHQGHLIQKEVIRAQAAQARAAQAESVAREALAETDSVRKRWQSALSALRRGIGFSQQKRRLEAQRDEVVAMMVQGEEGGWTDSEDLPFFANVQTRHKSNKPEPVNSIRVLRNPNLPSPCPTTPPRSPPALQASPRPPPPPSAPTGPSLSWPRSAPPW